MKNDTLRKFVQYREALLKEKAQIEARLREINDALHQNLPPASELPSSRSARQNRFKNPLSLKEAIMKVTSDKPLKKQEILAAIVKLGYRFSAKDPMNSLNVVLYGKNPRFKNDQGKFSPSPSRNGQALVKAPTK